MPHKMSARLTWVNHYIVCFVFFQSWDEGIAITAQKWADNCKIGHDERYKRYDYGKSTSNGAANIHCSNYLKKHYIFCHLSP